MINAEIEPRRDLITLPRRGVKIIAPEHTQNVMALARKHKEEGTRFTDDEKANLWPDAEKARLWLMKRCGVLAKRYPNPSDGEKFMEHVDYQRREELLGIAQNLTAEIVISWRTISNKDIAVVLFGSVAKGLVKRTDHPDPSNLDLVVMGDISKEEKERLLDIIRPKRREAQRWILQKIPFINSHEDNPGNAGVFVQNLEKVRKDNYADARNYITSGAIALYDPSGIWAQVESEALSDTVEKINNKRKLLRKSNALLKC